MNGTTITNTIKRQDVILEKREGSVDGQLLAGAEFRLYTATVDSNGVWTPDGLTFTDDTPNFAADTESPRIITGEDGLISFYNLPAGRYMLYESKAPEHHLCIDSKTWYGPWYITVTKNSITITDKDGVALPTNSLTQRCIIINIPAYELPETGGSGTLIYTLGGLLLMALPLMYIGCKTRRRKRKEGN